MRGKLHQSKVTTFQVEERAYMLLKRKEKNKKLLYKTRQSLKKSCKDREE